jgi:hypothetical protein
MGTWGYWGYWGHGDMGVLGTWGHPVTSRPLPMGGQDTPWGMWTHGHVDTRGMWTHVHVDRNLGKAWSSRDAPHICYLPPLLHAGSRRPAPMF